MGMEIEIYPKGFLGAWYEKGIYLEKNRLVYEWMKENVCGGECVNGKKYSFRIDQLVRLLGACQLGILKIDQQEDSEECLEDARDKIGEFLLENGNKLRFVYICSW